MTYAERLIKIFGGARPMARAIGAGHSKVLYWKSVGRIPDKYHDRIVNAALTLDPPVRLGPSDFSNLSTQCVEEAA